MGFVVGVLSVAGHAMGVMPWGTPLCPAGHLPHKEGDRPAA